MQLSNKEKRLIIIQDALQQIESTNLSKGTYLLGYLDNLTDPQKEINKIRENCKVCALGTLFLSHIDKFNKVHINSIYNNGVNYNLCCSYYSIIEYLNYFDKKQLDLIEYAFEGWQNSELGMDFSYLKKAYPVLKDRMKYILENMIKNDGEFIPQNSN